MPPGKCLGSVAPGHDDDGKGEKQQFKRREQSRDRVRNVAQIRRQRQQRLIIRRSGEEKTEQDDGGHETGKGEDFEREILSLAVAPQA